MYRFDFVEMVQINAYRPATGADEARVAIGRRAGRVRRARGRGNAGTECCPAKKSEAVAGARAAPKPSPPARPPASAPAAETRRARSISTTSPAEPRWPRPTRLRLPGALGAPSRGPPDRCGVR